MPFSHKWFQQSENLYFLCTVVWYNNTVVKVYRHYYYYYNTQLSPISHLLQRQKLIFWYFQTNTLNFGYQQNTSTKVLQFKKLTSVKGKEFKCE